VKYTYPDARKGDVVDDYHGTAIADPYRWLEDPDSPEAREWITAQNALTDSVLGGIPAHDAIHARLTELWNFERFSAPIKKGGRYFYFHNDGLAEQPTLMTATDLDADPAVLIDPTTLSEDGTLALVEMAPSPDGRLLAYAISDGGSDWRIWRVRDIGAGTDLPDEVRWSKFANVAWAPDSSGFTYCRYPEPEDLLESISLNQTLYHHVLGTTQDADTLVFAEPDHPKRGFGAEVSKDGTTLFISVWEGTANKNRLYLRDLTAGEDARVVRLFDTMDAAYRVLAKQDGRVWMWTNLDAPRGRVVAVELPGADWDGTPPVLHEIVPEGEATLEGASVVGESLVARYLQDAHTAVRVFDLEGGRARDVALPGMGTAIGFRGEPGDPETFYSYSSFSTPASIQRLDVETGEVTPWKQPELKFDPADFETRQVFYESADGTKIPMFLSHKAGLEPTGDMPTLLYGYGGFNISLTPGFKVAPLVWMEMGGVYAVPNLRGGGEYGEAWHDAGRLASKQNVFDDFIGAASWLIDLGYTRRERLAISGRSNGGLLVGAAITQRPDLFAAALPAVGVLDMLRYHLFTIGWAWADDYGRADDPEMFPVLHAYSPLHNIAPGTKFPATLILTGDHDDRVVPAHSFKFAAAVQAAHAGEDPVLIRIETRGGHGGGKSTSMQIDERAAELAFITQQLGVRPTKVLR